MIVNSKDRAAVPVPPPLIFIGCAAIAGLLECAFPTRPAHWPWLPRLITGGLLLLVSGILAAGAFIAFIRNDTPFDPSKSTLRIVRVGSYRFSRNPMYLALLLLLAGLTASICSLWMLLALPLLFTILTVFVVKREESYLTQKFGAEYLAYKASVRRWI